MKKGQTKGEKGLQHLVWTRITGPKYKELKTIVAKTKDETMSSLLRKIIYRQPVKVFVRDETLNVTMEELAKLRREIKAIGVNINQITRLFNTYPEDRRKLFYAKIAFKDYLRIETKIDILLSIITKLSKKWLSESNQEKR